MNFKQMKVCSLSIRKVKIDAAATFTTVYKQTPAVSKETIKSLGRWYNKIIPP